MKESDGGSIINISSIYGIVGSAGQAPYHAARAVFDIDKALLELAQLGYGIRVNSVHPGLSAPIWCATVTSRG